MKKVLIWLALILILIVGATALWMKLRIDKAPDEIQDPGLDLPADLAIPDPE